MAVTANQRYVRSDADRGFLPVAASTNIYSGTLVYINAAGFADDDIAAGVNMFGGVAVSQADNSGSAVAGAIPVEVFKTGRFLFTGSGFAQTSVGLKAYGVDNFTISLTATNQTYIGTIEEYVSATQVYVSIDVQKP